MRKINGDKVNCPYCEYETTIGCNLKVYLRKYTGDVIKCLHGDYETANSSNLKLHMRKHTSLEHQIEVVRETVSILRRALDVG